jgi:multicomponent Na+:H+ antiporter subunit E
LIEIIKSSFDVAKIVLSPKLPISPTLIEFDAQPQGPIGQAILGNSITLSPGTVTLDVHDGRLQVHCLTREGAQALLSGDANRRAAALTSK